MSKSKLKMIILIFLLINISFVSVGYAVLNSELTISGEAHVRVSDLIRITDLKVISKENAGYETYNNKYSKNTTSMFITLPNANSSIIYEVTVKNASSEKYQIKDILEESNTNQNIKYEIIGLNKEEAINENSVIKFQIKFTTTLSNQKGEYILKYDFQKYKKPIVHIGNVVKAYTYDEKNNSTKCIIGIENTCQETECYQTKTENSCRAGDIILYKVNDTEVVRFHVMFDEGETITMQQSENTVRNIPWISQKDYDLARGNNEKSCNRDACIEYGPLTILPALEDATKNWTNVNMQTYTMGTTIFKINNFTGCPHHTYSNNVECTKNTYTLPERTTNSRMITVQEASILGCKDNLRSCPIWMYNNLLESTKYGGTLNDTTVITAGSGYSGRNGGYWLLNADSDTYSYNRNAYGIFTNGYFAQIGVYDDQLMGARAVVVINK